MPGTPQLNPSSQECNPKRNKPRMREEIAAEIRRVDEAIADLSKLPQAEIVQGWRSIDEISVPVALRSLRHYRQRLARLA